MSMVSIGFRSGCMVVTIWEYRIGGRGSWSVVGMWIKIGAGRMA